MFKCIMLRRYYLSLTMMIALSLVLFIGLPTMAQQQSLPGSTPVEVSDSELDKAANAYVQIQSITNEFEKQVQSAQSDEERHALQTVANQKMIDAVKGVGLEVESFNNIMAAVGESKELNDKFTAKLQEMY
jgi:hypothetical protein